MKSVVKMQFMTINIISYLQVAKQVIKICWLKSLKTDHLNCKIYDLSLWMAINSLTTENLLIQTRIEEDFLIPTQINFFTGPERMQITANKQQFKTRLTSKLSSTFRLWYFNAVLVFDDVEEVCVHKRFFTPPS